ncbi:MAG: tricorn protease [Gemmatales bacterium]|nr:MAG: tricorn protease [Gemmatales bacterium]
MRRILAFAVLFFVTVPLPAQEARLLRFPAIHQDKIVFTYAGNLYTVSAKGGIARRLTNHDGFEMFARFSPDGKHIAFTGQYDGNTEVYLMPAEGGSPKRLTFTATLARDDVADRMGPNNIVMGWKGNSHVVFRSRMIEPNSFNGQLFLVPARGGLHEQVPLPRGGFCSYSPDGKQLAYNRIFREFRTWKRYRGGMADDIWIHDFQTRKTTNITNHPAQDIIPMWWGQRIYFLSDRDNKKRFNLYVYDLETKKTRRLTNFSDFDIKFPSLGKEAIVFEKGGYIYRFDLKEEKAVKVPVRILEDETGSRPEWKNVKEFITRYEISPDGARALFVARGDIFTVPAKDGPTRNLTQTPGVHERDAKWSPDGRYIAYISDASGEDEIYIVDPRQDRAPVQLTHNGPPYKYTLYWSPDSKKILWADKLLRLHYVDITTKKVTLIAQAKAWEIRDYAWSPDSRWVAYSQHQTDRLQQVFLYSLEQHKSFPVTKGFYESYEPIFSGDGKYLFFVSDRDFNPIYSRTEWNHAYVDMSRIYFVTLSAETPSPFQPKSDEVKVGTETPAPKPALKPGEPIRIDLEGIQERVLRLPITPANYTALASVGDSVFYLRTSRRDPQRTLLRYDLGKQKETSLGAVTGYEISADGKKMLINQQAGYAIIDLPAGPISVKDRLDLSDMNARIDRRAEWQQIFDESWRQMRDFFYAPNMHGVDWKAVRKQYEPLLKHVNHRNDLTYIIGEMIGELNAGHCYVSGGDRSQPKRIRTGLLGAQLRRDEKTGYYQITRILKGSNWDKSLRSPLAEIGVNVKVGDYILAVDGKPTNEMTNIFEALVDKADKQVRLTVNSRPTRKGRRDVVIRPIADEHGLYYYNMVQDNIEKVNKATNGQVGYIHIPDMMPRGLNEFAKHFYPQLRKRGLIIDVRGNGGGNVSPMIIERLRREVAMIDMSRDTAPRPDPFDLMQGPMVCLMNEFSASDGDLFPYRFKHYKLGKLIGKRSWGGVVGIRGSLPFLDGGELRKPEFAPYSLDGKRWIIEGHGVDPDIVVDNDPAKEFAGEDQQLNRAIEEILKELKKNPPKLPPIPPFPRK